MANIDTGKVYREPAEIAAALVRGERVIPVSEAGAQTLEAAGLPRPNRKTRRALEKLMKERKAIERKIESLITRG